MRNISEILKECPKGTKLYSPIFGDCALISVGEYNIETICCETGIHYHFYYDGTYIKSGECMLFPSKEQRDWDKFQKRFKVGDRIRKKGETSTFAITDVNNAHYFCGKYVICDTCDNDWELVPNKFDISTLKPFDKVLVRTKNFTPVWTIAFFDGYRPNIGGSFRPFGVANGEYFQQCIPYEGNEHLRGTTNDCDEYYSKNWE